MKKAYEAFREENFRKSEEHCVRVLDNLYQPITDKVNRGTYTVLGGYDLYKADRARVEGQYMTQAKGPAKEAVFSQKFHRDRANEAKLIMKADKKLSDAERQRQEDKRKQEQTDAERKRMELENERQRKLVEEMRKSHQDQVKQFTDRLATEMRKMREVNKRNLDEARKQYERDKNNMLKEEREQSQRQMQFYEDKIAQIEEDTRKLQGENAKTNPTGLSTVVFSGK